MAISTLKTQAGTLANALARVLPTCYKQHRLAVLTHALIEPDPTPENPTGVQIRTTTMETGSRTKLNGFASAPVLESSAHADTLYKLARQFEPTTILTLELTGSAIVVKTASARYELYGVNPYEYPVFIDSKAPTAQWTLTASQLVPLDALKKANHAWVALAQFLPGAPNGYLTIARYELLVNDLKRERLARVRLVEPNQLVWQTGTVQRHFLLSELPKT